ncbi:hypothetical protein PMAN_b0521 [Pseudoalteromonas marina]|nr:hypothetical protein PMAN_b0521 [Pseudoalteromonas marina]GAA73623.1 hypothetical protein P20480_0070 [Pseudoalteromonas sp. BSi20480]
MRRASNSLSRLLHVFKVHNSMINRLDLSVYPAAYAAK